MKHETKFKVIDIYTGQRYRTRYIRKSPSGRKLVLHVIGYPYNRNIDFYLSDGDYRYDNLIVMREYTAE